jgi:hypothetical protein
MSQRDVAFALELVARALGGRMSNDPEESRGVDLFTLEDVAAELNEYAATLKAAPIQVGLWCESHGDDPCVFHPLGGPDCAL